jgi:hypothetical protein
VYNQSGTNYEALKLRGIYAGKYENIENYLIDEGSVLVDSVKVINFKALEEPINISCNLKSEVERINNKIYIAPFLDEPVSVNPFKQDERAYPIDMEYKKTRQFFSEIEIPEGYKLDYLPSDQQNLGKLVQYDYKISQLPNNRILVSGYYAFSESIYKPEDYLKLKAYYNDIIKIFNEKIVLVKNEP